MSILAYFNANPVLPSGVPKRIMEGKQKLVLSTPTKLLRGAISKSKLTLYAPRAIEKKSVPFNPPAACPFRMFEIMHEENPLYAASADLHPIAIAGDEDSDGEDNTTPNISCAVKDQPEPVTLIDFNDNEIELVSHVKYYPDDTKVVLFPTESIGNEDEPIKVSNNIASIPLKKKAN